MGALPKVLVVDDDSHIGELVKLHLEEAGFRVTHVMDGSRGYELARSGGYDLVVLDVMLPGKGGVDICRDLRAHKITSRIMMLTNRGEEIDKILGLELGADDYVTKPFSIREVVARAKALVRRDLGPSERLVDPIVIGQISIDPTSRVVQLEGKALNLTSTEFDLLYFLAKHPGRAFSREHLLHAVWGYTSSAYEHTVNTHINRLRSKIEQNAAQPTYIQTVWGIGYKCAAREDVQAAAA
jgi:DNA-binding response OmpR family regulator